MKYETPEMTTLTTAINAIQSTTNGGTKSTPVQVDSNELEHIAAYADWE
jgi:hypothetical protein